MNKRKILVSGASIAGLTLAYWLNRYGFEVTVIERADELRLGGQNIDVKGPALEIVRKMKLEEKIRAANTTEVGIRFVNTQDKVLAEFPKGEALSMTQELEILRGDLVRIFFDEVRNNTRFLFGDQISTLQEQHDKVQVTFQHNPPATFEFVLIAEGIGSRTRQLVFGKEVGFKYLGIYTSYFTVPKASTDSRWARWCNATGGIVFLLRPDNYGSTRASIFFRSPERGYEKLSVAEQKQLLIDRIQHVGWEALRLMEAIRQTEDLYLERLSQIKLPRWSKGRVAITGDAAYCVTPIGGRGTDLAISGAYLLAGELYHNTDFATAFDTYERRLRPLVRKVQKLPPGVPRLVYPSSKLGVTILNKFFALLGSKPLKLVMKMFGSRNKEPKPDLQLPDYQ